MKRTKEYRDYLASTEWKKRRARALMHAGNRCQVCNTGSGTLDVHHRTYKNFRDEPPEDLVVLCRDCHTLFHDRLATHAEPAPAKLRSPEDQSWGGERLLLLLLVRDRSRVEQVSSDLTDGHFNDEECRELFAHLASGGEPKGELLRDLHEDKTVVADPDRTLEDVVETMLLRPQLRELERLRAELAAAAPEDTERVLSRVVQLDREIKARVARFRSRPSKSRRT